LAEPRLLEGARFAHAPRRALRACSGPS
jgi:hypothetical protein